MITQGFNDFFSSSITDLLRGKFALHASSYLHRESNFLWFNLSALTILWYKILLNITLTATIIKYLLLICEFIYAISYFYMDKEMVVLLFV